MLQKVLVQTANPMVFDIENVDTDEILILTSISGLSKAGATLFTGEFASGGGYYQGRRPTALNPVLNFKINPDYENDIEVSDVREMLYRMFMDPSADSDAVQVVVVDDRKPDRYFRGYTESIEADIFEKTISATVSMLTTDPYLRSVAETSRSNEGGLFASQITYDGSADTGIEMTLKILSTTTRVVVSNNSEQMVLNRTFNLDDTIEIGTVAGSRYIRHNGEDIMSALSGGSKWIQLRQAANSVAVHGGVPDDGKVAMTFYKYRSAWWGI